MKTRKKSSAKILRSLNGLARANFRPKDWCLVTDFDDIGSLNDEILPEIQKPNKFE